MSLAETIEITARPSMKRHIRRKPRKASSAPITLASPGDRGATGPANLERMVEEERGVYDDDGKLLNPNRYRGNRRQPWFEKYAAKGKLTHQQHTAAARLFAAYEGYPARDPLAAIGESIDKSLWGGDPLAAKVDQRREFYRMWSAVPVSSRPVIEHVVLNDRPLRAMAGCSNSHTEERHMQRLRAGLDAIA